MIKRFWADFFYIFGICANKVDAFFRDAFQMPEIKKSLYVCQWIRIEKFYWIKWLYKKNVFKVLAIIVYIVRTFRKLDRIDFSIFVRVCS